ncbi:MAG: PhoH family protein [Clostridia bacterium]|nr:PhoH family protein [Clostridia bacterium]
MTKIFVLRPHALLASYDSLSRFGRDNVVVIPMAVIDEINAMKELSPEKSKIRKHVLKYIKSLMNKGITSKRGYKLEKGGYIRLVSNYTDVEIDLPNLSEFQKRTLQVCVGLKKQRRKVILITNNLGLQIKASTIGIEAEEFRDDVFPILEEQYKGRVNVEISDELENKICATMNRESTEEMFNNNKFISRSDLDKFLDSELIENEYVLMTNRTSRYYGQVKEDKIILLENHMRKPYDIEPKNNGQKFLMNALYDDIPLVVVKGAAGTGKTLLSIATALERVDNGDFKRILITREVSNDKLGYLPGNVDEKLGPFMAGVKDALERIIQGTASRKKRDKLISNLESKKNKTKLEKGKNKYSDLDEFNQKENNVSDNVEKGEYFFERGIIKIQALEMIRGRSIMDTIFIIDETQNIDPEFIKTIVTRAAEGSKFIFLGDPTQVDNPKLSERYNALVYLAEKMKGDPDCAVITLEDGESVRSRLARTATKKL